MTDFFTPTLILIVVAAVIVGAGLGISLMVMMQRSQNGGKSLSTLRQEKENYQHEVDAHFEKTAHLFKDMTENYRQLYEHMASGAQNLCKAEAVIQPLDLPSPGPVPGQLENASTTHPDTTSAPDSADQKPRTEKAEEAAETVTTPPEAMEPPLTETETQPPSAKAENKIKKTSASPQDVLKPQ